MMELLNYNPASPMLFTQFGFWVFFGIVLLGFSIVYKRIQTRNLFLLLISLLFYYKAGGWFVLLLFMTTLVNFFLGKSIGVARNRSSRKVILIFSLVINLGILSYCKYSYFFIDILNSVFHTGWHVVNFFDLISASFSGKPVTFTAIILPIGISFYTFQIISYSVEVYRKKFAPITNFIDFAFYIAFFPQVISGPIVKSTLFVPQIRNPYSLGRDEYGQAILLILGGLVKKMVIADYISLNFVSRVFENPNLFTGFENLTAIYGYTLQIYCDFSGYTDIAIGIALLLGFRLPANFNSPYKARNIAEFWKRWHMSLTNWFRDYMFLPLAYFLSDRLKKNKYFGLRTESLIYLLCTIIVFLVCGLWHGARMNFVIWGGLHGLALVIHKFYSKRWKTKKKNDSIRNLIPAFITFHFIALTWVIFRSASYENIAIMTRKIFFNFHPELILQVIQAYSMVFILILTGFILHWIPANWKTGAKNSFIKSPEPVKLLVILAVVLFIYQFKSSGIVPFIYFEF